MSKFKPFEVKVTSEPKIAQIQISDLDSQDKRPNVKSYDVPLVDDGTGDYAHVKAKFGPLAATDQDRVERSRKSRRFSLNPLLRSPLSIEEEERRAIESRVQEQIDQMAAEALQAAERAGYEEGLKRGMSQALLKVKEEGRPQLERFDAFIKAAEGAKDEIYRANEKFLIDLVFRIAKVLLMKDLSVDRNYVTRLASELIQRLGVKENIKIKIGAKEAESIEYLKSNIENSFGKLSNLSIEVSHDVDVGCIIETDWNIVDANLETQIQGIFEAILRDQSRNVEGSDA